jgi:glutamate formiminotransferase
MSGPLLECVPNVSEGRRADVVERLARAARSRPGARLLDLSSDRDHDRTVLTLAGTPDALVAALLALFEVALAEIDLSARAGDADPGVHPCMGAVDVVPFVPLGDAPMALAVATAERFGREVAERFDLPVYLYEEAARRPERRNLADVRRGGFEGLAARYADPHHPLGQPDFGPARPHPTAGAVAVGARGFLVAFNVVLASDDLGAAREIARAVRESSPSGGGLPAVKALGVRLASRGRVQVSMNLVDPVRTTPVDALRAVRREAEARGLAVQECELVGLVPESVAARCLEEALPLPGVDLGRTVERRLAETADEPDGLNGSAGGDRVP